MYYKKTQLIPKVLTAVQSMASIRYGIAKAHGVSRQTTWRWSHHNDPQLCEPKSLRVIQKFISLPDGESFTEMVEIGDKFLKQS